MVTCGYICPVCAGREIDENGITCHWCQPAPSNEPEEMKTNPEDVDAD